MSLAMSVIQSSDTVVQPSIEADCMNNQTFRTSLPHSPPKRPSTAMDEQMDGSSDIPRGTPREGSPTPSSMSSLTSISATPAPPNPDGSTNTSQPPAKRRKLTPAEREVREREKSEKKAQREENKARREVEKQKKDEERRQKNEVLEEKKREKELKKQEKKEAKRLEEEERAKKERAQSRMTAFFAKPKASPKVDRSPRPDTAAAATPEAPRPSEAIEKDNHTTPSRVRSTLTDYEKTFLPFAARSNSTVARANYFTWDEEYMQKALQDADGWFAADKQASTPETLAKCLDITSLEAPVRGWTSRPVAELVSRIDGTQTNVIDLTQGDRPSSAREQLREQPMKYLYFHEDVRPPYVGTVSKLKTRDEALRIARRPCKQHREDLDYDYDSEAEWEEPEEGEDLGSEGEDEDDSMADAEELEEFLDDEGTDDARPKKRFLAGDMQPISTGLCWETQAGKLDCSMQSLPVDPSSFRMEVLSETFEFPIDPFSTSYWPTESKSIEARAGNTNDPQRPPLQPRNNSYINSSPSVTAEDSGKPVKPPKPAKECRLLIGDQLEEFKKIVEGSDLTKVGLLAFVKKKMPKVPNAVLNDTLSTVAARVGVKEVDKRWRLVPQP